MGIKFNQTVASGKIYRDLYGNEQGLYEPIRHLAPQVRYSEFGDIPIGAIGGTVTNLDYLWAFLDKTSAAGAVVGGVGYSGVGVLGYPRRPYASILLDSGQSEVEDGLLLGGQGTNKWYPFAPYLNPFDWNTKIQCGLRPTTNQGMFLGFGKAPTASAANVVGWRKTGASEAHLGFEIGASGALSALFVSSTTGTPDFSVIKSITGVTIANDTTYLLRMYSPDGARILFEVNNIVRAVIDKKAGDAADLSTLDDYTLESLTLQPMYWVARAAAATHALNLKIWYDRFASATE